jgi:hypothetical protein
MENSSNMFSLVKKEINGAISEWLAVGNLYAAIRVSRCGCGPTKQRNHFFAADAERHTLKFVGRSAMWKRIHNNCSESSGTQGDQTQDPPMLVPPSGGSGIHERRFLWA